MVKLGIFCSNCIPLIRGPSFASYLLAVYLQKRGFEVTLFYPNLLSDVKQRVWSYFSQYPPIPIKLFNYRNFNVNYICCLDNLLLPACLFRLRLHLTQQQPHQSSLCEKVVNLEKDLLSLDLEFLYSALSPEYYFYNI